jgi:hypothetical protein
LLRACSLFSLVRSFLSIVPTLVQRLSVITFATMDHILGPRGFLSLAGRDDSTNGSKPDVVLALAPPGVEPNFIDPPSRGPLMVGVSIAMASLTTLVILARIYTKAFVTKAFDSSDYFAIGALVRPSAQRSSN